MAASLLANCVTLPYLARSLQPRGHQVLAVNPIVLWTALVLTLPACTSLPPLPADRALSTHFADPDSTTLGRLAHSRSGVRVGESGVRILDTGAEAFAERAALIEAAERTIDAQYYIWNSDATGRYLAERLYLAAERGVRVRILLDDVNVSGRDDVIAALDAHPNLDVRIYNPFADRAGIRKGLGFVREFARLNRRMHNKSFTVDGAVTIIGGRNIGDEYFDADPELNFRDRDVVAVGPVVAEAGAMFDAFWNSELSYPIAALARGARAAIPLDDTTGDTGLPHTAAASRARPLEALESSWSRMITAPARLVHDLPPAREAVAETDQTQAATRALAELARAADEEVLIESAYLVMDDATLDSVKAIRARGVAVVALTNSLASNDVTANHAAYARRRGQMLQSGIELFEFRPDAASCRGLIALPEACAADHTFGLHAKTFVFDRTTLYVGSLNLNLRSAYLNAESAMIIESPALASIVAASIDAGLRPENSWQVVLDDHGKVAWPAANPTGHDPSTSWWRRVRAGFIALFPLEKYL